MASVEQTFKTAEKALTDAKNALDNRVQSYTYKGKKYSLTQLNSELIPQLKKEFEDAKRQTSIQTSVKWIAETTLDAREADAKYALSQFKEGKISESELRKADEDVSDAQTVLDKVNQGVPGEIVTSEETGKFVVSFIGEKPATAGAVISPSTAEATAWQKAAGERLENEESLAVKGTPKIIIKNGVRLIRTEFVDGSVTETPAEPVEKKVIKTPTVIKTPKAKKAVVAPSTAWEAEFRATFPAKAWLLDQDRTKYPQLFALLQKAHDEKYYESTEGQARFAAELQGVDFYRELAASGKVKEIKKIVGDLGFDSTDFSKFVTDSINFGWTGETLKAETYKEVFRKNPDGTYANPTSVKRTTVGNDYLNVQLIAKNFFNSAPQSSIESVLTGTITTQDFQRQQREIAKKRYGHLSDLIDQGVTLEDLAGNYRSSAAKLLEVDPNTIDMSAADYEVALTFGEEGKKRAMTTGEWEKLLRTDARYGWEKTENAKTEARSLANNLAQAFGRII
jgi:hypothetical protein